MTSGPWSALSADRGHPGHSWARQVSNLRPLGCKPSALPLSYAPQGAEGTWRRPDYCQGVFRSVGRLPFLVLVGLSLVLATVCTWAGIWQIHRYDQKRVDNSELRRNDAAAVAPVEAVLRPGRPADAARLRKVTATGTYDPDHQVLVRQRTVGGKAGFLVATPLRTGGGELLVVRGFVPASGPATQSPPVPAPPTGTVRVTGRVFPSEPAAAGRGLPAGQVERLSVPELTRGPAYGGYIELLGGDTGLVPTDAPDLSNPAGGAFEGQHLAYVVQWFFFAMLALAGPIALPVLDRRAAAAELPGQPADTETARQAELTRQVGH
jgi:cytochrome oxidase assembly protein ShyY1